MSYLTRNEKMKRSGKGWWNWSIPAYQAEDGFRTCPGAKDCIMGCYARPGQGWYGYPHVKKAQERRLALSKSDDFINVITHEIKKAKVKVLRIHDAGDFYSVRYAMDWGLIMLTCPDIQFYAYTKNIPLVRSIQWPKNFTLIYSEGGKWDSMIDRKKDRHSRVFICESHIEPSGYANASHNDSVALGENHRIGLAYHDRSKDRAFQTGEKNATQKQEPNAAYGTPR